MTTKKLPLQQIKEAVSFFCDYNTQEQMTALFEYENGVSFANQTPDEISTIMLNKIGFKKRNG